MIFVFHSLPYIAPGVPIWVAQFLIEFQSGVTIFFVLSGFLIASKYQSYAFESPSKYLKYVAIRLTRIFPLYLPLFLEKHSRWLYAVPDFILHLALLKGFFKTTLLQGIVQAWTLTVEITFYLLAPFLFWLTKKRTLSVAYFLVLLTGVALTGIGMGLQNVGYNPHGFMPDFRFMAWSTFFGRSTEFFMGIVLSFYLKGIYKWPYLKASSVLPFTYVGLFLFCVVLSAIAIMGDGTQSGTSSWIGLFMHHTLLPFCIFIFLYGLIYEDTFLSQLLSVRLLLLLGNASYAFYLLHFGKVQQVVSDTISPNLWLQYISLWILAIGTYLLWEKPIYRWVKRALST